MLNRLFHFALSVIFVSLPTSVFAQSYSIIDDSLNLYCADLPDATNMVVSVTSNQGLYSINPVDPEAEKAKIIKLRKQIQKRINTLSQLKRDFDPAADGAKLRQVFKFVINEVINDLDDDNSLESTKPNRIYSKISAMIQQLKQRIAELNEAIEIIDRCVRNEELIPPPEAPSAQVVTFPFIHPDYGTAEVMRGVAVTATLHKKRSDGIVCVSAEKPNLRIPKFPKETAVRLVRNPCLAFFQTSFRNYPFCHYGSKNTAVAWVGSSAGSVGFSSSAVDEDEIDSLQRYVDFHNFTVRVPTKKKPCRTK